MCLSMCSWMSYCHVALIKHLFTSMNITHYSTEGGKRRLPASSLKAVVGCQMKLSLIKTGFAFSTFNLNDEDACSLLAAKVQASLYTQMIEFETQPVLVFWFTFSSSFESSEHLCCQTKQTCLYITCLVISCVHSKYPVFLCNSKDFCWPVKKYIWFEC